MNDGVFSWWNGTQAPEETALLLENDRLRDDGDDVGRITDTLYVFVRNATHATSSRHLLVYSHQARYAAAVCERRLQRPNAAETTMLPEALRAPREPS